MVCPGRSTVSRLTACQVAKSPCQRTAPILALTACFSSDGSEEPHCNLADPYIGLRWFATCLRPSPIVRGLPAGLPLRLVAAVHDTSANMIARHYGAFCVPAPFRINGLSG